MRRYYYLLLLFFTACVGDPAIRDGQVLAYVPVYVSPEAINDVGIAPPRTTTNPGKIYAYQNLLFQVEQTEGIHIIDNSNPRSAQKIGFLKVPLCSEIAIKSGFLYTNHADDLVVFSLANISAPQLVKRLEGAFPQIDQMYPPVSRTYFECADPAKGVVVRWEQKLIKVPNCRR